MVGGAEGKFRAVVFALFGTLVAAPTAADRSSAAAVLAAAAERPGAQSAIARVSAWLGIDLDWARHRAG